MESVTVCQNGTAQGRGTKWSERRPLHGAPLAFCMPPVAPPDPLCGPTGTTTLFRQIAGTHRLVSPGVWISPVRESCPRFPVPQQEAMGGAGIEPATPGFSVLASHTVPMSGNPEASQTILKASSTRIPEDVLMAAFLSLLFPGLGQIVWGRPLRGIVLFAITAIGYAMMVVPGIVVHLFVLYDAQQIARKQHLADMAAVLNRERR